MRLSEAWNLARRASRQRVPDFGFYRTFVLSVVVGITGALATALFRLAIEAIDAQIGGTAATTDLVDVARALPWYWRIAVPAIGGVIAGAMLVFAHRHRRPGRDEDYMDAVTVGAGNIGVAQTILTTASSLASIASGSSIGREGPMVQLAALCASLVGKILRMTVANARLTVACGAAAGITAAYNAPVAGALFVSELVLGSIAMARFGPVLIAAVASNMTMRALGGYHPTYAMPDYPSTSAAELVLFAALGIVCGLSAPVFLTAVQKGKSSFSRLRAPLPLQLALGGAVVGVISLVCPEVWGNGYSVVSSILHQPWPWRVLLVVLVAKVAATVISAGSGAVGGVFTPTLFVGAVLGCLFGESISLLPFSTSAEPTAYAIAGMGAILAAATQAPLMAVVMMFEMTGSYQSVLPLIVSAVVASAVANAIGGPVMYGVTVRRNLKEGMRKRLAAGTVRDLVEKPATVVHTDTSLAEALCVFERHPVRYLYVVSRDGDFLGVIALRTVARSLATETGNASLNVGDLLSDEVITLHGNDTYDAALEAFLAFPGERLPVVDDGLKPHFVGIVRKSTLLRAYADAAAD
ncbi:CIC family chloride channel protein [Paraburkholderia sp. BL27I4N3]|uniref:ClcB-like voltage-gated chloride channel protein n=1 Tax=Paraburkholderia sp. BL27I4N3 TaxID=1938805 RepID=UPI000E27DE5A|nr:ClcB-like voltage-gated chloride channel protein [Paraburkholderia sp. BL27I4N3]REE17731.1 CIC family chloride channel protein [Paraburkholderia sp. BL27I4N3]